MQVYGLKDFCGEVLEAVRFGTISGTSVANSLRLPRWLFYVFGPHLEALYIISRVKRLGPQRTVLQQVLCSDTRQWRGNQMRLVMTSNGNDRMGGGAGSGEDGLTRWLLVAIRDRYPTDWVKRWSCLQKLAEEEGEENRRLDNPFNIWACSCALRRSILSEAHVQLRAEGGREVAVVVHAVFLFKVLRVMDQMTNQIEGL
ncbi:hypothetical protein BY996DRAFT_6459273 [Phakopsora pachyrhizi]|nr:hypothetical protein BY996DRAFT_6459273 [Phakopsora pachyrhizi]